MIALQNKKVDRRIKRTQKFLKDALIFLIEKKGYDTISVSEIVRQSHVNRSTFYAHYQDKEELMSCIINELVRGMIQSMRGTPTLDSPFSLENDFPTKTIKELFTYVEKNVIYFQSIMNNQHDPQLIQRLSDSFYKIYFHKMNTLCSDEMKISVNKGFYISYFTSVIIGFIYHWLINTEMKYSSEYIARELSKLICLEPIQQ